VTHSRTAITIRQNSSQWEAPVAGEQDLAKELLHRPHCALYRPGPFGTHLRVFLLESGCGDRVYLVFRCQKKGFLHTCSVKGQRPPRIRLQIALSTLADQSTNRPNRTVQCCCGIRVRS
jgi:hypothetical protein